MKNFFAFTLIVVSTIVMAGNCDAFQGPPGREGGPRGERGQRGGPGGERGQRGGPGGERGQRGGPGGERGGRGMEIPIIQALDADKDGEISKEEMANAATTLATLDKNGDGVLQRDEMMPTRGGRRGGPGGGGPGGGPRGGEGGASGFVDRMMENDADGDGKISADEAPERMQGFFERLDGDKDGFLTKEEITEASNRWSGGGGGRGGRGGGGDGGGQRPKRPASE